MCRISLAELRWSSFVAACFTEAEGSKSDMVHQPVHAESQVPLTSDDRGSQPFRHAWPAHRASSWALKVSSLLRSFASLLAPFALGVGGASGLPSSSSYT